MLWNMVVNPCLAGLEALSDFIDLIRSIIGGHSRPLVVNSLVVDTVIAALRDGRKEQEAR